MADSEIRSGLKRKLKSRHMTMIAIGGSIGTGLFVSSGYSIATAGPGGAIFAYALIGLMVYFLMTSLGELSAFNPSSGSFATFGSLYVDKAFGFAQGWNYWYNWAITLAVELVAAAIIMGYWFPDVPGWIWSALFYILILGINLISVKGFGETEFWFSFIKVATVIIFITVGLLMIFGILKGETGNVDVMNNLFGGDAPFVGGIPATMGIFMIAAFSFQGTELLGVAAGESADPEKNIPKATRQIFWRILLFYVLSIFVIGALINYTDPNLLKTDETDISFSPFTLTFQHAGLAVAASVMNAVILTSVLSAGNSGLFASSRILYDMGRTGLAPKVFAKVSKAGVPVASIFATAIIAALCFLTSLFETNSVYINLLNASGMCGFVTWIGIAISHYRFRKACDVQNLDKSKLPYLAKYFPIGPILALIMLIIVIVGQDMNLLTGGEINVGNLISTYIGLALFFVLYLGYKIVHKTKIIPYSEVNLKHRAHHNEAKLDAKK